MSRMSSVASWEQAAELPDHDGPAFIPTFNVELRIEDAFGAEAWEPIGTIDEFLDVNRHLEVDQVTALLALMPGDQFSGNEGAGGTWSIRRAK